MSLILARVERAVLAFDRRWGLPWPRARWLRWLVGVALPLLALTVPSIAFYSQVLGNARFVPWVVLYLLAERPVAAALDRLPARRFVRFGFAALAGLTVLGLVVGSVRLGRSSALAQRVAALPIGGVGLQVVRAVTDFDRDGYSALFGGGDCAGFDSSRRPLARERPANGIDEDCDGADAAPAAAEDFRPTRRVHGRMADLGAQARRFNIVWLMIDTVRADHTSLLGYSKRTTPYLEALGEDALVFERAYSQGTATALSMQSVFSGMDPGSMRFNQGERWLEAAPDQPMFAERVSALGYDTLLVSLGALNARLPAVQRGFREISEPGLRRKEHPEFRIGSSRTRWINRATAPAVVSGIELIERNLARGNKPFFLLVYTNDPHEPYVNHPEGFPGFGSSKVGRYDSEIAFVDRNLGFFTEYLRYRQGLWENTIIVVSSDHGEEFGEHGATYHGTTCHRQAVHVPLLVRIPGLPPKRVSSAVALVDIIPTLLEAIGADAGNMRLDGQSLLVPSFAPDAVDPDRPIFCTSVPNSVQGEAWFLRGVRTQRRAFIKDLLGAKDELYDVHADFAEEKNLIADALERANVERLGKVARTSLTGNLVELRAR
jgi:arylsulfatase A-like enzyme